MRSRSGASAGGSPPASGVSEQRGGWTHCRCHCHCHWRQRRWSCDGSRCDRGGGALPRCSSLVSTFKLRLQRRAGRRGGTQSAAGSGSAGGSQTGAAPTITITVTAAPTITVTAAAAQRANACAAIVIPGSPSLRGSIHAILRRTIACHRQIEVPRSMAAGPRGIATRRGLGAGRPVAVFAAVPPSAATRITGSRHRFACCAPPCRADCDGLRLGLHPLQEGRWARRRRAVHHAVTSVALTSTSTGGPRPLALQREGAVTTPWQPAIAVMMGLAIVLGNSLRGRQGSQVGRQGSS